MIPRTFLKEKVTTALNKVNELFANGMWTANDNPAQTGPIKNLKELLSIYDYYYAYIDAIKDIHPIKPNFKEKKQILMRLQKALQLNDWFLNYTENQSDTRTNLLNSFLGSQFVDLVEQRVELLTLYSIFENSVTMYSTEFQKVSWVFQEADPLQFSDVFLRKVLAELFLSTKFDTNFKLEELVTEIVKFKELIQFRPRDFTALLVLEFLLEYFIHDTTFPSKDEVLIKINKNGLINGGDYHLFNEFQDYLDYLINALHEETSILSEELLRRKTLVNIFDSITWLVPDFNKAFKEKIKIPIYYLPFNRAVDGIVTEN